MKLSVSNIAWPAELDERMYASLAQHGFSGLEIAPTRLYPQAPYAHADDFAAFGGRLYEQYGLRLCSMQSIWYGRSERIFGSSDEREALAQYTAQAVRFAHAAGCPNLVFGCPKNRVRPDGAETADAEEFFSRIGADAYDHGCVIALEANPPLYGTNYLNTTDAALNAARRCGRGVRVNLDVGAMVANGERADFSPEDLTLVSHVHLSEPGLVPIERRELHSALAAALRGAGYTGYVSLEMKAAGEETVLRAMDYLSEVFS